ncbi:MAG: hypothetical protein ACD_3C00142G0014 [uncultured bacterium (gcode 4)]|uniref:Thioredoxin domain-containing protein n=1 Tax=uncultured bacterium (gcode 4) TaxID=1234023 RepID=K2FXZ2_9BACT|nr:MAG: hypothetical protein ACD_3C00142G0014 [uncultured bacterium (gcode 4)]
MDWKSLKNKALDMSSKALEASTKAIEQGKDYIEKAKEAKDAVVEKAQEIKTNADDIKDKAVEKIEEGKEKIAEIKEKWEEKIQDIKDKTSEKIDEGKEKVQEIKEKWEEKVADTRSFAEKLKNMGSKAMESTTWVLGKSAPMIKIMADYETIKDDKILALLFLKKDDEESKKFQLSMPMIMSSVWINGSTFRVIDIEESKDVAENFKVTQAPFLIVYEKWEEKKRTEDISEIKRYLKEYTI